MSAVAEAVQHKERGNAHFKEGEFREAIQEYTNAIIKDPSNAIYYTNRAMSHYKLENYDPALSDAERAVEIDPKSLKGYYYRGLAQRQLGSYKAAEGNLRRAYEIALSQKSPSATAVYEDTLVARKLRIRAQEKSRIRQQAPLLAELEDMLTAKYKADVAEATQGMRDEELADELDYLKRTYEDKIRNLESVFAKADKELEAKEVPDYLLDPISFNLYMDPVIVKSGQSFERSWILQHLKTSKTDPFSRERLTEKDLIPNLQLKAAAEDFMNKHATF